MKEHNKLDDAGRVVCILSAAATSNHPANKHLIFEISNLIKPAKCDICKIHLFNYICSQIKLACYLIVFFS